MWMNEYEIDRAVHQFNDDRVLSPAVVTLANLRDAVNRNSDGWPYWQAPAKAADRLMGLIIRADHEELRTGRRHTVTAAEVRKALTPIKSFRTKHSLDFVVVAP